MKKTLLATAMLSMFAAAPLAQAATGTYNVTTTWDDSMASAGFTIFNGSFLYDSVTHVVTGLHGSLSESMTGSNPATSNWLTLNYQVLPSWHDDSLGGTFAATFKNNSTVTFKDGSWLPGGELFVVKNANPQNAYALIFVPDSPLTSLTQAQIDKLAYADCAPGGLMAGGTLCMTGTSIAGYGSLGSMDGYPISQTITAAVPEPESYAMLLAGLGLLGFIARRRRAGS